MSYNPYENYLETQVLTASPLELVEMLYKSAIESLQLARLHLRNQDTPARLHASTKATNILIELVQSLDHDRGGQLIASLNELYDYMLRRLHHANTHSDDSAYDEVIHLLSTLLQGWQAISQSTTAPPSLHSGQPLALQC